MIIQQIRTTYSRVFYGWIIVALVFVIAGTAPGLIYAFPVFFDSIAKEFGASRAEVSAIFSIAEFVWFLSGFAGGFLADRWGPAKVVLMGAFFLAGGMFFASLSNDLNLLIACYALGVGIGGGLIYIPSISLVPKWFKRRRGLASGIAVCGTGVGTLVFPILGAQIEEVHGWSGAHLFFAFTALFLCGGLSFFLIASPEKIGAAPDGEQPVSPAKVEQNVRGKLLFEAVKMRAFWHLYIASLFASNYCPNWRAKYSQYIWAIFVWWPIGCTGWSKNY